MKKIIPEIGEFLEEKLKLSLHKDKIIIRRYHGGIDFLGYVLFPHHRILRTKTKRRMLRKINWRIKEVKQGVISEEFFNQAIQSYLGILKHCDGYKMSKKIRQILSFEL